MSYDRDAPWFFPILLVTHIALAVSLFVPSLVFPFVLRRSRARLW